MDGFDEALIGRAEPWDTSGSRPARLVYDGLKIVDALVAQGMSEDEAVEYIEFNMESAYVGPHTPIIVWPMTMDTVDEIADMDD
jgi:hypothetical protein